jgi:hypothetical protein
MEENRDLAVITALQDDIAEYEYDTLIALAEHADKMVIALKKIMNAALRITTWMDWVLIGGKPYLQETGATKVATLFGIGWEILNVSRELDEGYPSFTYRIRFMMGKKKIECDGSRSGKEDFFTGRGRSKGPDEIDANDVKMSAYTNCLNNGIKRLIPGLRNIDCADLENAGVDVKRLAGYTFKEGAKGGKGKGAENSGLVCAACSVAITQKVASYSESKYGAPYCMDCQKKAAAGTLPKETAKPTGQKPAQAAKPSTSAAAEQERLPWDGQGAPPPDDGEAPGGR